MESDKHLLIVDLATDFDIIFRDAFSDSINRMSSRVEEGNESQSLIPSVAPAVVPTLALLLLSSLLFPNPFKSASDNGIYYYSQTTRISVSEGEGGKQLIDKNTEIKTNVNLGGFGKE